MRSNPVASRKKGREASQLYSNLTLRLLLCLCLDLGRSILRSASLILFVLFVSFCKLPREQLVLTELLANHTGRQDSIWIHMRRRGLQPQIEILELRRGQE